MLRSNSGTLYDIMDLFLNNTDDITRRPAYKI